MQEITAVFINASRKALATWLERIQKCVDELTLEQIWWRGQENSNAIGNLMLHLSGNVRQWIASGVGGAPDTRNRNAEFAQRDAVPAAELLQRLRAAVADADQVLASLTAENLLERRQIQKYDVTVLEAIHHVTEHFALHTGQIIYATKLLTGQDLGFYRHLQQSGTK
jgi:uncharacterized damage-inducible protein DinB